jgi:hypothetical protein
MPEALKWRRKVVLAKIESAYGTDPTPAAATDAMLLSNVEIRPMEGEDTTREIEYAFLGSQPQIPTGLRATLTASVELVGSGEAGTAPAWGVLARICALDETVVASTSVTYAPISTAMESATLYFWVDGIRQIMKGCRGTAEVMIDAQGIPMIRFTITGLWAAPTDTAMPSGVDLSGFQAPIVATAAHTPAFTINSVSLVLRSFRFDLGNQVEPRLLIGREEIIITDKQEQISCTVEAVPMATLNPFALAQDPNTTFPVSITHGITAGFITTIAAPRCQMMRLEGYENNQDVLEWPLRMRPLFDEGNDQFSIVLT